MPPRLSFLCPPSLLRISSSWPLLPQHCGHAAGFHSSRSLLSDDALPNHYETLQLNPNATPADIKRQFYTLSKLYHPDLARSHPSVNEDDADEPSSTPPQPTRFHQINEAYHVLGVPEARQRYDRDWHRHYGDRGHRRAPAHPQGSHSSHSSYAGGSRPASGLSRRRSQFRGPPPSFYQQGQYGQTAGEGNASGAARARARQAGVDEEAERAKRYYQREYTEGGGFGPGQESGVFGDGVPHFDHSAHRRTQDGVASTQSRSRAARRARAPSVEDLFASQGSDMLVNFIIVGGIVAFIASLPYVWYARRERAVVQEYDKEAKS